jgi:hypothetical protein
MKTILDHPISMAQLKRIAEMTANNEHGDALELIAEIMGYKKYKKIFYLINLLHTTEGCMPPSLMEYRTITTKEMFNHIKSEHGAIIHDQIYSKL